METLRTVVGKRDSEFTGLKGHVLRYAGTAFFCTIFGLLAVAAGERNIAIAGVMQVISSICFICALALYPFLTILAKRHR